MARVKVRVDGGEITSYRGDDLVTQPAADIYLERQEVRGRIPPGETPVRQFSAFYYRSFEYGDVDMELLFLLKGRTATEAVFEVHDSEPDEIQKGIMAPSSEMPRRYRHRKLFG